MRSIIVCLFTVLLAECPHIYLLQPRANDANGQSTISQIAGHPMALVISNIQPNRWYEVQRSRFMPASSWATVRSFGSAKGTVSWEDPDVDTAAFYRLKSTLQQPYRTRLHISNYMVYYGFWDRSIIPQLTPFNLVVLNPNNGPADLDEQRHIIQSIRNGSDGIPGTSDDVKVLGYVSMGEDQTTFNHGEAEPGDGTGPCYYDRNTGRVVYEHNGFASYYLDEWDTSGPMAGHPPEHDGLPDRNGEWGACYVNPGDFAWQKVVLGLDRTDRPFSFGAIASTLGCDGFFMDTADVASPWEGFGWTAKGVCELIKRVRDTFPDKVLLLNRGLFFFMPMYPYQYQWNPRYYIDAILFESYYLDNAYGTEDFHISPYFAENHFTVSPKLNAELGRPDSFSPILSLNYAKDPNTFYFNHSNVYNTLLARTVREQGRIELLSNQNVDSLNTTTIEHVISTDREAPKWLNSCSGYVPGTIKPGPRFMALGATDTHAYPARVGVQKAIPSRNAVTLRWDAAIDQSRPVKYNIYYSTRPLSDLAHGTILTNVFALPPADYTNRTYTINDDSCPYEYTVDGLSNNVAYYFNIRAEDSTTGVTQPQDGDIGPSGGIEETNSVVLAAAPRSTVVPITIDGNFEDWAGIPAFEDFAGDAPGGEVDWLRGKITDDLNNVYLYFQCAKDVVLSDRYVIFLNTDRMRCTGYSAQMGADYMIMGGTLYRYQGDGETWNWTRMGFCDYSYQNREMELGVSKKDIQALAVGGGMDILFYGDNSNGVIDYMPDAPSGGFTYSYLVTPNDITPPAFDTHSLVATDAAIDGAIRLEWSAATDVNGPVQYDVFRDGGLFATTMETQICVSGLTNQVEYTFWVRASDKLGNFVESVRRKATPTQDRIPPIWAEAPGIQKVIPQDGMAKLYWNRASDESHPPARFNVYYDTQAMFSFASAHKSGQVPLLVSDLPQYAWMFRVLGLRNLQSYAFAVRCEDRAENEDTNGYQILATPRASPRISTNSMDGAFGDWDSDPGVVSCGLDAIGDGPAGNPSGDIVQTWLANDANHLFVRWKLNAEVNTAKFQYMVFIHADADAGTGYRLGWNNLDPQYMSINGSLYRYTGTGANWSWTQLSDNLFFSPGVSQRNEIEMAIPRTVLNAVGEYPRIKVCFAVSDRSNLTTPDVFPDEGMTAVLYPFAPD